MLQCLYCGSKNLFHFREWALIEKRKITSDCKISKKIFETYKKDTYELATDTIDCFDCGKSHWYDLNDNEQIISIRKIEI